MIKHFESLALRSYKCSAGVTTVGYGHTGSDVKEGMFITEEQADKMLLKDLHKFETQVNTLVDVEINQNQFDALVGFAFNLGSGALASSTLLKKVNAKDFTAASYEFEKWSKARIKGVMTTMKGLLRRRLTERYLWEGESLESALLKAKIGVGL